MRVIVYGTLKRGGALYDNMTTIGAEFVKEVIIKDHEMYNTGWFPAIIEKPGKNIHGEVFEIDQAGLDRLDQVEGYPDFYNRKELEEGFIYYWSDPASVKQYPVIADGNFKTSEV